MNRTLFDKLWDSHVVLDAGEGWALLFVDRHLLHDGSFHAFGQLRDRELGVEFPQLNLATADHYVPTDQSTVEDPTVARVLRELDTNVERFGIRAFPMGDARQGIVHVIGPEQGFTLPGTTLVCGDSHTATHGAFGALAFGIGASEVAHVLATQCLWQRRPRTMRIDVPGMLPDGVAAKDLALATIATIGASGAAGHAVEWTGTAVSALSMAGRSTLSNLTVEAGAKIGLVAPDQKTFDYLRGRPLAPEAHWDQAVEYWQSLAGDDGAAFDRTVTIPGNAVAPMVTWGTSPAQAVPVTGQVPQPREDEAAAALAYMGLRPGQAMSDVPLDQVFVGSCANGRLEDLEIAAAVVAGIGGRARVPTVVSPGSSAVKKIAEERGLAEVFVAAGMRWRGSGCSMCVGMNGDLVGPGKRCASTSNRNFVGRQGRGSRTHLVSPATAAASAMLGHLACAPEVR